METQALKEKIEKFVKATFEELDNVYYSPCNNARIIFPKYAEGKVRVSEQELRCVFIHKLHQLCHELYYSVETPSKNKYRFTDKDNPKIDTTGGESARIDLTIHENGDPNKRLCIVEFKAHGGTSECNYKKDLLKLYTEPEGGLRYFIQIFESYDDGTRKSVGQKLQKSSQYIIDKYQENKDSHIFDKVHCRFYSFKFRGIEEEEIKKKRNEELKEELLSYAPNHS